MGTLLVCMMVCGLVSSGYHFDATVDVVGAARALGVHIVKLDNTLTDVFDKIADNVLKTASTGLRLEDTANSLKDNWAQESNVVSNSMETASDTGAGLVGKGMELAADSVSKGIMDASVNAAESIYEGFNEMSGAIRESFFTFSEGVVNSTVFMTQLMQQVEARETNEFLLSLVNICFIFVPILLILYVLVATEKKEARRVFVHMSIFGIALCITGAMMQYFRLVFGGTFTMVNISISFYLAFYFTFFVLYLIYAIIAHIISIWNTEKVVEFITQKKRNDYAIISEKDKWKTPANK